MFYFTDLPAGSRLSVVKLICEAAYKRNRVDGVTGPLVYAENMFFRLIEGLKAAVTACYAQIGKDTRPHAPVIICENFSEIIVFHDGAAL